LYIGLIAASYGLSFFISSLIFGRQSDKNGRVVYICCGLGLSAIAYLAQVITNTPVELLIVRGLVGFSLGITSAAVMAYTYENQKKVGGFASYGSLGWLLGAIAAAILNSYEALFIASAIASAIAFFISLTFKEEKNVYSYSRIGTPPVMKENRKVLFSFFLRQLAANAVWAILPLYLASMGASKSWIAILDGINMGLQFIIMQFIDKFNPVKLLRIGLLSTVVVFIVYGTAGIICN
jgi:MFS family permease